MAYRDRSILLRAIGALLLIAGIAIALIGPIELYSFYLFSRGGRFHYEGFGFGSFLFGFIAMQIVGYYVIGALLIPLGVGHLRLRRWTWRLALACLWCWLVLGVPILLLTLFTVFSFKELPLAAAILLIGALALTYPLLPILLIRFYRSVHVRLTFENRDAHPKPYAVEQLPMPHLVLAILCAFYVVVMHFPIIFNGLFPLFGRWLSGLPGIIAWTAAIASLVVLTCTTLWRWRWAWWCTAAFFSLLGSSTIVTLCGTSYTRLLSLAAFPPQELQFLDGVPFEGWHLAAFFGLPLLGTLAAVAAARPGPRRQSGLRSEAVEPGEVDR